MTIVERIAQRRPRGDQGFGLAEVLVAMVVLLVIMSFMFSTVFSTAQASKSAQVSNDSNEEARIMLTRMARELREANAIVSVTNPGASGSASTACDPFSVTGDVSITFDVDFSGDGVIQADAADPEEITYRYDAAAHRVSESAAGQSYPVLAGNVTSFKLSYSSRLQQYDGLCDGQTGGTVFWSDLDKDTTGKVGNNNGVLDEELSSIDSVTVELSMQVSGSSAVQTYRTQVDLRNASA